MENKKMTTPIVSVGADTEQPPNVCNDSITDFNEDGKIDANDRQYLGSMDPLFTKIQKMFLEEQNSIYGTDHIYGIDLFNELEAPSYEPSYLRRVSRQVYQSLEKADKKAVWLQMTWLFWNEKKDWTNERIKAYITAFPSKKSLLLDYYCERHEVWQQTDKYFGVPYIWCYLGNFGGNTVLVGNCLLYTSPSPRDTR